MVDFALHLIPLPALTDNYIWLLHDDDGHALVVDPGEAAVVEHALSERSLRLHAILLTHHHPDHIAGAEPLKQRHGAAVYAPDDHRIGMATTTVRDADTINLELPKVRFDVLSVPGHTLSHLAFVGAGLLFCGDTLFSLGCGRLFEGSAAQMQASLDRLAALPDTTLVCAGHEYTEANGRFAQSVDPDNEALRLRRQQVRELREQRRPSLPATLASERACNPFLRSGSDAIATWCLRRGVTGDRTARFAAIRDAKDHFSG